MQLVNFSWQIDREGYEVRDGSRPPEPATAIKTILSSAPRHWRYLTGRSGDTRPIRPLEGSRAIFVEFANAGPDEQGAIDFANQFGMLYTGSQLTMDVWADNVSAMNSWVRLARDANNFCRDWNRNAEVLARSSLRLGRNFALQLEPASLLDAAFLQLVMHVAAGGELRICQQCKKPLGPGPGNGKRSTSKHCGNVCRQRAYRQSRAP